MRSIIGIAALLFGLASIAGGLYALRGEFQNYRASIIIQGEVIGEEVVGRHRRRSVVRFSDPNGKEVIFKSEEANSIHSYIKGERVRVAYNPKTREPVLESIGDVYGAGLTFAGLGLIVGLIGSQYAFGRPF